METNVIQEKSSLFTKVFIWMFMGLFATGVVSYFTYATGLTYSLATGIGLQLVAIIEVLVVIVFSLFFRKLPPVGASILFFLYAIINGVSMSTIFYCFELNSIILIFFASSAIFGISAFVGYICKVDLSKIWTILYVTLIVGVIVSVINIFVGNSMVDIIITWVLLLTFLAVTAYDMQNIKRMAEAGYDESQKLHIYGAMELYLDFINIFIRILSLFGKRKD